jgi:predicted dehydrogenase
MSKRNSRRNFIKTSAAIGAGYWVAGGVTLKASLSANEEIRFGCIGIGGKGSSDSADAAANGKVVAICDIDESRFEGAADKFPGATKYTDYRKMLEEMGDSIDAVTVSTPDHTHAVAAMMAMRMGKHCFCQKPLTHSIEEARMMGTIAAENKLVTQMGNQGTAEANLRMSAALIKKGIIGTVKEVHVWTNRPVWPQSVNLKIEEMDTPPANIHWDLWLGPVKKRPFSPEIHPFKWRGFWDFGTGALGDMACHTLNMAYMALNLRNPTSVESTNTEHDRVMYPKSSKIKFEFPELDGRPALTMYWYDGGAMPPSELIDDLPKNVNGEGKESTYDSAALLVGDKGRFYSPGDYGADARNTGVIANGEFVNQRRLRDQVENDYVRSPGHFVEFAEGIRGNGVPMSNFPNYSGPLSETILLGNLAVWSGEKVDWNAQDMIAANASDEVKQMVRHQYHNGYSL